LPLIDPQKKDFDLFLYQLKLVAPENKFDEFVDSIRSISGEIRKERGCLGFGLYRDLEKQNAYRVLGEWKTREARENHFNAETFSVLIGAARVLGDEFEMSIDETTEKGSYRFVQEKIALNSGEGKT